VRKTGQQDLLQWQREFASEFEMKDLGGCTLGIRGVMRSDETFLIQGILMRFDMMEYKSMTTPMMTNLKKLSDFASDSDLVDPMMYMK
jgi:hypothetical protein